jgi:exosortase/archaeosortase family protein
VNVEVATQCSGIRSSLALCITCLLGGHLTLQTGWRKAVFVLAAIPMAMFKNGVRIVTLSLLAIHVDMSWLTNSKLHHDGGIVFFLTALLMLWPLLLLLRWTENRGGARTPDTKSYDSGMASRS